MDVKEARRILGLDGDIVIDKQLTKDMIRKAFLKKARYIHPDSPLCTVSKAEASIYMSRITDARNYLLNHMGCD